jgi:hypothetical protein
MADLALRVKIFIASPSDVLEERNIAEKIISQLQEECARQRLLVQSFRWEKQPTPGYEPPQTIANRDLRSSELTIVILWSKLGSLVDDSSEETGTQQELRIAGGLARQGKSDDVFLYFRKPTHNSLETTETSSVTRFKDELRKCNRVLFFEYDTVAAFRRKLRSDLRKWSERWYGVSAICEYAARRALPSVVPQEFLADNRISDVARVLTFPDDEGKCAFLGRAAVSLYQKSGVSAAAHDISGWLWQRDDEYIDANVPIARLCSIAGQSVPEKPLVLKEGRLFFSHTEWFFFFCAFGLVPAIVEGKVDAVLFRPYVNPVHQYFKALSSIQRTEIIRTLRSWLINSGGVTSGKPIARNFAAYVLGMIGAIEAQDDLAQALQEDPGEDVKLYSITSIGKLRARRQLQVLVNVFNQSLPGEEQIRDTAAQAICRIVGFLSYEL